jgi:hypothetical protein
MFTEGIPFFFDHLQEVAVVNNLLENGSQRKTVMSTERGRETNDGY